MKLTGKAKEQFDNWLTSAYQASEHAQAFKALNLFYKMPNSMQWGAYQDWADSLGINVEVFSEADYPDVYFDYRITEKKAASFWGRATIAEYTTRQEARNAAIESLNELINQNK